jgi:hypothetical protein
VRHPLDGVWAKLRRGDEHVRAYRRAEAGTFRRKKPPSVGLRLYFDDNDSTCVVMTARVDELPLRLGVLVGDAVHNYRSALDQLVFELAFMGSQGGTRPPGLSLEKTMFPGSETRANFESGNVQTRLLAGLTQKHRAYLKRFQPYRGRKLPPPHPISRLMDLSNDDKHRLTQPVLICPTSITFDLYFGNFQDCEPAPGEPTWGDKFLGRPLKPDTEIVRFPIRKTGPKPYVKVKGEITKFVGFQDGTSAVEQLTRIGAYARGIVEFFAPEFDRPIAKRLSTLPRPVRLTELTDVPDATSTGGLIAPTGERIEAGGPFATNV